MFTMYHSDFYQSIGNCLYPHRAEVGGEDILREAVSHDYVCALYRDGYRSKANFIGSDCLPVDCDNDHSENPDEWVTPATLRKHFPDVAFAVHYSRNHMKEKDGKPARPRFHVFFPISYEEDAEAYALMKRQLNGIYPFFDRKALDAARFFFGTKDPRVEIHNGSRNLTDFLDDYEFDAGLPQGGLDAPIHEGERNSSMYRFAVCMLKRYGDGDGKAEESFRRRAGKCEPPLEDDELGRIWRSALKFYGIIKAQKGYVAPEDYGKVSYRPEDYSDVGQSEVLAKFFYDQLRYSPATHFIRYRYHHWQETEPGAQDIAHELTRRQLKEARAMYLEALERMEETGADAIAAANPRNAPTRGMNEEQEKAYSAMTDARAYMAFATKRRDSKFITAALRESRPMLEISPGVLDADGFALNTPEATYDLRKGMEGARPHSPDDYITRITAVSPGAKGAAVWDECLKVIFQDDGELIEYVQRICGLAAVGKVFVEALIIAYGDGSNGKSTFWNVVSRVLGSYSGTISADTLTTACARNVKPEMAEVRGKRLLIAAEMQEGARLNDSMLKQLCSTDEITAEKKYKDPFSFRPCHTLVLYTNHLPKLSACDGGTLRRLIVIPFGAKISGGGDIKNYADHLFANAGEAVLAWVIEGARKVIESSFSITMPACVREAIDEYRRQNDWLANFIDDRCVCEKGARVKSLDLYQAYRSYAQDANEFVRGTRDFTAALQKAGYGKLTERRVKYVKGLRIKNEDFSEADLPDNPF